jgi:hypothetical protein
MLRALQCSKARLDTDAGVAVMVVPLEKVSYLIVRRWIKAHGYRNE